MGIFYSKQEIKPYAKMIYGYIPDSPSEDDQHKVCEVHPSIENGTIKVIDLRDKCPNVYDQGKLGSCTANAICGNYAFIYMKENNLTLEQAEEFSRLFVYWNERSVEGTTDKDSGASLRDGIKVIHKYGVPLEKYWPYDISKYAEKPTDEIFSMAQRHVTIKYSRLRRDLNQLKQCLANGDPFVFGFSVYDSFESEETAKTGIMTVPTENETLLGGHAVMCVGVDENKKCFIVRNSWGTQWGDKGYFYMPYDVMFGSPKNHSVFQHFTSDFWCIETTRDTADTFETNDPIKLI